MRAVEYQRAVELIKMRDAAALPSVYEYRVIESRLRQLRNKNYHHDYNDSCHNHSAEVKSLWHHGKDGSAIY